MATLQRNCTHKAVQMRQMYWLLSIMQLVQLGFWIQSCIYIHGLAVGDSQGSF